MHVSHSRLPTYYVAIPHFALSVAVYFVVIRYYLGAPLDSVVVLRWGVAAWALDLIVNVVGTLAIASRLWWVGRKTASIKADKQNAYLGVAFIILESGAMFSTATFILVILFVNPPTIQAASAGINVVMQLAVSHPSLLFSVTFPLMPATSDSDSFTLVDYCPSWT